MNEKIKPKGFSVMSPDVLTDIEDIKDILEAQHGIKVSKLNVIRALIKNWYETSNNG